MKTADFYVGYRPVRLGLLVRDNNLEDLMSAIELNTLLWGGIFNPIIPVGSNNLLLDNLVNSLQTDFLLPLDFWIPLRLFFQLNIKMGFLTS